MPSHRPIPLCASAVLIAVLCVPASTSAQNRPGRRAEPIIGAGPGESASLISLLGMAIPIGVGIRSAKHSDEDRLPAALIAGGVLVGPALGYVVYGEPAAGMAGVFRRAAISGISLGIAGLAWSASDSFAIPAVAALAVIGGGAAVIVSALNDTFLASSFIAERRSGLTLSLAEAPGRVVPVVGIRLAL